MKLLSSLRIVSHSLQQCCHYTKVITLPKTNIIIFRVHVTCSVTVNHPYILAFFEAVRNYEALSECLKPSFIHDKWCIFMYLSLSYVSLTGVILLPSCAVSLRFEISCADSCRRCPENGVCGNGELRCSPGFRRQGALCVPDTQIDRIAHYLVSALICFLTLNVDLELNITTPHTDIQYSICTFWDSCIQVTEYQKLMVYVLLMACRQTLYRTKFAEFRATLSVKGMKPHGYDLSLGRLDRYRSTVENLAEFFDEHLFIDWSLCNLWSSWRTEWTWTYSPPWFCCARAMLRNWNTFPIFYRSVLDEPWWGC